jgi:hypothetical protein
VTPALPIFVSSLLTIGIVLQLFGGIAFPPVTFRASQPRAYWGTIAVYCVALMAVVAIFILWR